MKARKRSGITHVAAGTAAKLVDFAESQIFGPAGTIAPVPAGAPRRSLQHVLAELHASEINAGLQTFFDAGVRVWIGDELNGRDAEATLGDCDAAWRDDASLAHWLHETALRLFPESGYARRHTVSAAPAADGRARDGAAPPRGRARRPDGRKSGSGSGARRKPAKG